MEYLKLVSISSDYDHDQNSKCRQKKSDINLYEGNNDETIIKWQCSKHRVLHHLLLKVPPTA
jgi:hypothetical protein